jgi:RNA polymerase sigma-70 factor (ECF subfamily)
MLKASERELLFSQYEQITADYHPMLLRISRLFYESSEDRGDLCQDILINIWQALPKFRGDSKLSTWVYRIALNTAITHKRKHGRRTVSLDQAGHLFAEAEQSLAKSEEYKIMMQQVQQLPALDKAIVLLYLEQMSYEEIASIMGMTVTNVGSRISRIKERLRKQVLSTFTKE